MSAATPEQKARIEIDRLLNLAGWAVQDVNARNLAAARGVAIREMQLRPGFGAADYILYVDRKAVGVIEAKKEGETLTGVETQSEKYSVGLPAELPAWHRPLPFLYQSTGVETRFTNLLDPDARSRDVFAFHRPETLAEWVRGKPGASQSQRVAEGGDGYSAGVPASLLRRLRRLPPLITNGMRLPQIEALIGLEKSLAADRRRGLIQMTMGSGKTYAAVAETYRLIKHGDVNRVLFLVDRANLGKQALGEFDQYVTPDDGRKFTELYNVQHLRSNVIDPVARVCITTIQRLYSILKGEPEFDESEDEKSAGDLIPPSLREPLPVVYNANIPPDFFSVIWIDECHRSIFNIWRQALEYFDAYLIGLTATPNKQAFGFFQGNLVSEYSYARAVADGVNVDHDIYRIRTRITEQGATVEAGLWVDLRDRKSRRVRWQELDADLTYEARELDRSVVSDSQIRTVVRAFRDRLFTEIFPDRREVPKTLIFAKSDEHADDIVRIVREEFGKGNDFCEKITYKTSVARIVDPATGAITYKNTGIKPEDLLSSFRNSYNPRIVVTVDMIATGTDVRPLEIVFFMRDVKSANFYEQMKGRGSRTVKPDELQAVTGDAKAKTRFVLIDAVGVTERVHTDAPPLERKPTASLRDLLKDVAFGSTHPDVLSTVAARLARLEKQFDDTQKAHIAEAAGMTLVELTRRLANAIDPDRIEEQARTLYAVPEDAAPTPEQLAIVAEDARFEAVTPLLTPALRDAILDAQRDAEQILDRVSQDELLFAGADESAREKAAQRVATFREYLETHRSEITALQVLYSHRAGHGPTLKQLKELSDRLAAPPQSLTPELLWNAYRLLESAKALNGRSGNKIADLVSLVRFAIGQSDTLAPFDDAVQERFAAWLTAHEAQDGPFTAEQRRWLEMIRDCIAASLSVEADDFDLTPFSEQGGLGRAYALFGDRLTPILEELNAALVA